MSKRLFAVILALTVMFVLVFGCLSQKSGSAKEASTVGKPAAEIKNETETAGSTLGVNDPDLQDEFDQIYSDLDAIK